MKRIIALFLWAVFLLGAVSREDAFKIARKWAVFMGKEAEVHNRTIPIKLLYEKPLLPQNLAVMDFRQVYYRGEPVGYLAELLPSGYILIPMSEGVSPVKFYSFRGRFQPERIGFHRDLLRLLYLYRNKEGTDPRWEKLLKIPVSALKASASEQTVFGPLVQTRWAQGDPYNKYTPTIGGYHTPTGCVATAYAQIMKFWSWPDRGRGSHTYYWEGGGKYLSANFNHPYYWDKMPASLEKNSSPQEIDAVARLMYDVGVAVDMDYGLDGSGAYPFTAIDTFPVYFKYSDKMSVIGRCLNYDCSRYLDAAQWFVRLKAEIDQFEPFEFSIFSDDSGHAVVVDGYKRSSSGDFIHINMGWGGSYDGFYSVDKINPGHTNFNRIEWEYAVINVVPASLPPVPSAVKALRYNDRGVFVHRYVDVIEWEAPASGEGDVSAYEVLQWDTNSGFVFVKGQVSVGEERKFEIDIGPSPKSYRYAIRTIAKNGRRGKPSSFVSPRTVQ